MRKPLSWLVDCLRPADSLSGWTGIGISMHVELIRYNASWSYLSMKCRINFDLSTNHYSYYFTRSVAVILSQIFKVTKLKITIWLLHELSPIKLAG